MAEVAIPIAVLGAMYIISNKNDKKESLNLGYFNQLCNFCYSACFSAAF